MRLALTLALLALVPITAGAAPGKVIPQICWIEYSATDLPGAMGGQGITETKVWHSTFSGVLVRHPRGDMLIDTGLSPDAPAEVNELPKNERTFGQGIVKSAKNPIYPPQALAKAGEGGADLKAILITHAHYDHMGGALTLTAPVLVSAAEKQWITAQAKSPTIVPPSMAGRLSSRLQVIQYDSGAYMGFAQSKDYYGDHSVVVVPLPGHTPGSQGVFLNLPGKRLFLIGDTTDTLEAAYRGLPKSDVVRSATDFVPELADRQAAAIARFHRAHPDIAIIPAHDRTAYAVAFGQPFACTAAPPRR